MANYNTLLHIHPIVVLSLIILQVNYTFSQDETIQGSNPLPICLDYKNLNSESDNESDLSILIEKSRTNQVSYTSLEQAKSIKFELATNIKLKCIEKNMKIRALSWDAELDEEKMKPRNFNYVNNETFEVDPPSYFTSGGYFYDNVTSVYYKPDGDYCIQTYSSNGITLKVCEVNEDCSSSSISNTICVPKCCAIDEVLQVPELHCVKRADTLAVTTWNPPIFKGLGNPYQKLDQVQHNLMFYMASLPKTCNLKSVNDGKEREPFFKYFFNPVFKFENKVYIRKRVELVEPKNGENGKIEFIYVHFYSRRWKMIKSLDSFCVDGLYNKESFNSSVYTGNEDDLIVFFCDDETIELNSTLEENIKVNINISLTCLIVLLAVASIIIHAIFWEKQNLHGMIVFSYAVATLGIFLCIKFANYVSLLPDGVAQSVGLFVRGQSCYTIAALGHYFFLISYFWLLLLCYDLWLFVRSIGCPHSHESKWKNVVLHCLVVWIIPLAIIRALVVVDKIYRDPTTEVHVPHYTIPSCSVTSEIIRTFLFVPLYAIIGVNILLIVFTIKLFLEARRQAKKAFLGGVKYTSRIILVYKLIIVWGGALVVDFLIWYYNSSGIMPRYAFIIEYVVYALLPIAVVVVFCLNKLLKKYAIKCSFLSSLKCCGQHEEERPTHLSILSNKGQNSSLGTSTNSACGTKNGW